MKGLLHHSSCHSIVFMWSIYFCLSLSFVLFLLIFSPFWSSPLFLWMHPILSIHVHLPLLSLLFPPHCNVVSLLFLPWLWWVVQLALLQYRLSMSSMLCQPLTPPGSGTLHTYQVLFPFHSIPLGLLEVNLGPEDRVALRLGQEGQGYFSSRKHLNAVTVHSIKPTAWTQPVEDLSLDGPHFDSTPFWHNVRPTSHSRIWPIEKYPWKENLTFYFVRMCTYPSSFKACLAMLLCG